MVQPILPPPSDDTKLWRYMDFIRLVSLLETRSLWFCRADLVGDPFEGAKGSIDLEKKYDDFYRKWLRNAILSAPGNRPQSEEELSESIEHSLKSLRDAGEHIRKTTFLNCWHASESESDAMWRLYAGWKFSGQDSPGGVAIVSTFGRLRDATAHMNEIYVGKVKYVDFGKQLVGINEAFWHKSLSFEHEREVRAVLTSFKDQSKEGVSVPISLTNLVSEIIISPNAPVWFEGLVRSVLDRYSLVIQVRRSTVEKRPFY